MEYSKTITLFKAELLKEYVEQASMQIPKLIGSLNILGNIFL